MKVESARESCETSIPCFDGCFFRCGLCRRRRQSPIDAIALSDAITLLDAYAVTIAYPDSGWPVPKL